MSWSTISVAIDDLKSPTQHHLHKKQLISALCLECKRLDNDNQFPSIHLPNYLSNSGWRELIPAVTGWEPEHTLNRSPVHNWAVTQTEIQTDITLVASFSLDSKFEVRTFLLRGDSSDHQTKNILLCLKSFPKEGKGRYWNISSRIVGKLNTYDRSQIEFGVLQHIPTVQH